jgi:protein-S-isoprenylcysteine O-methyltransferase Ste14
MKSLIWKATWQGVAGLIFFAVIVFATRGRWDYWRGWLFLAVFTASTFGLTAYMALYDKPLLQRRLNAGPWKEEETSQKIIVSLIIVSFFASVIFPILDYRWMLSPVPAWVSILGSIIIALSFLFIFWVLRVNSFAASNISVASDQTVISNGPYAYVRHPMYSAAIWLFVGTPLALGSWWTLALIVLFFPLLLWRLLDEERVLRRDLQGYREYTRRVRYRLVPLIW